MVLKSRNTIQKEIIAEEINKFSEFFSAEDLYKKVSLKDQKVSIPTIYRYLKSLREKEDINSFICCGSQVYSKKQTSHCHFICDKCGDHIHFKVDNIDFLKNKRIDKVRNFSIDINGICDKCANRE